MTSGNHKEDRRDDDLERLRKLLLDEDRSRLNELNLRISDIDNRSADVAEVLPDAFRRVTEDPVLEAHIEKPMMRTIRASIKRDPQAFAEHLFPVMGPAIRRAVADALKSLVQRINLAMEHSFTVKGLRWRIEAARSGIPFAQVVLRHTMRYAVQEAFLINRDSGLVLSHAHRDENLVLDEDAVAAMLSAIQSFIQDSLGMSADEPLRSAELGDSTLWVINGPEALLACVITGTPPRNVRDDLMALLETIHARFAERFNESNETIASDTGLHALVQQALREEADNQSAPAKRKKAVILWAVFITLLVVFAGWITWQEHEKRAFESRLVTLFGNQPGYLVSSSRRRDGKFIIQGLRDPAASEPADVLTSHGLSDENTEFQFKSFWSLETGLVKQRLRASLGLPDSVGLELEGGTLILNGQVNSEQLHRLDGLAGVHPLVDRVELSGTRLSANEAIQLARSEFRIPDSVGLTASGDRIELSGSAEIAWYLKWSATPRVAGGWKIDFSPLLADLQERLRADAGKLDKTAFLFARQDRLMPESLTAIDTFSGQLSRLLQSADALGLTLEVTLSGETDGTGTAEQNDRIARKRVEVVRDILIEAGIDPESLRQAYPRWSRGNVNSNQRRVTVHLAEAQQS